MSSPVTSSNEERVVTYPQLTQTCPWLRDVQYAKVIRKGFVVSRHSHEGYLELFCCQQGMSEYNVEGKVHSLGPGDILVIRPGAVHWQVKNPYGFSRYAMLVRDDARYLTERGGMSPSEAKWLLNALHGLPVRFHGGKAVLSQLREMVELSGSVQIGRAEKRFRLRAAVGAFLAHVIDAANIPERSPGYESRMQAIVEEMQARPERSYMIDELADRMFVSPSLLTRSFKRLTGYTPHAWLVKCRLGKAQGDMLLGTSISDVAERYGFCSTQHFCLQFKKETGLAPRAWLSAKQK